MRGLPSGDIGLSFLENELVRFTEPSELNDPADCAPRFYADRFSPQDYEEARWEAARTTFIDFGGEPTLKDLEDFFLTMLPRGRVGDIDGMFPRVIPALRREPFSSMAQYDDFTARRWYKRFCSEVDRRFGIFSVTADPVNQLMWADYAASHRGLVIGFDTGHPFFTTPTRVAPVQYTTDRVSVSSKQGTVRFNGKLAKGDIQIPPELLFRKHPDWAYQQEWRLVRSLHDRTNASEGGSDDPHRICLFRIPSNAVRMVAIGSRMSQADRERFLQLVENPRWCHVELHVAAFDDDLSAMRLKPLTRQT